MMNISAITQSVADSLKKGYRKPYGWFSWPSTVLLILLILFVALREPIFRYVLNSKIEEFNQKYHADISVESISFSGLSTVNLHGFVLKEIDKVPLIKASSIKVGVNFWKLILKRVSIESIAISDCNITMEKNKTIDNYSFLLKPNRKESDLTSENRSLSKFADRLVTLLFDLIPKELSLENFRFSFRSDLHQFSMAIPSIDIDNRTFLCHVHMNEPGKEWNLTAEGVLDKSNEEVAVKLYTDNRSSFELPWLQYRNQATVNMDTAFFKLKHDENSTDTKQVFIGSAMIKNLSFYQKRIAEDTVKLSEIGNDFTLNIGNDYVEFDSTSTITINELTFHPYAYYRPKPSKRIILSLYKPMFEASELFRSLPQGLFTNFTGIEVSGKLSYYGFADVDLALPDSMVLKSDLWQNNFRIVKPGVTDFSKINDTFTQHIFEQEEEVKTIELGPSNPNFIPFERIPISLKNSILMSEDGWFFEHGGFSLGAFREAMIADIKAKRFVRGGSTISMQLIKNVFLNRKKNIARKLEEFLIVWIIEKQRLVTKERMFEIYVNIIEWGPGIYGAEEAAKFYFNKSASELTLNECIYLAAIIPSPKHFKYLFNEDGSFREYILNYYDLVLKRMVEKEKITQEEADATLHKVILSGVAKDLFQPKTDSTLILIHK